MSNTFDAYKAQLLASFASRLRFEAEKACASQGVNLAITDENAAQVLAECSPSTLKNLTYITKGLSHDTLIKILAASKVNADFLNREERSGSRFNMYAAKKITQTARALASVGSLDHYTFNALATAQNFASQDFSLTHADLHCAYTATKSKDANKTSLIAYFVNRVAFDTATTQASSSVNCLQAFDVLVETRDASGAVAYKLNSEGKNAKKLLSFIS